MEYWSFVCSAWRKYAHERGEPRGRPFFLGRKEKNKKGGGFLGYVFSPVQGARERRKRNETHNNGEKTSPFFPTPKKGKVLGKRLRRDCQSFFSSTI
jgi:hypothetical protein